MQIRLVAVVLLAFIVLPAPARAQFRVPNPASGEKFAVELGLMFWSPNPEIRLQTGALAAIGETEVDLVQEFGIENKRFNEFRSVLKAGRKHKVGISHVLMEYHQRAILQRNFVFGGQVYPVSAPATADLEWRLWRFGYEWDFVAMDRAVIGFITELKYNDISSTLAALGVGGETTEVTAPMPTIGGIARVYPHKQFSITVEYTGFKVPGFIGDKPKIPTMCHFGELDQSPTLEQSKAIAKAHPEVTAHFYAGAGHGFNCDHRGSYNAEASKMARGRTLEFFRKHLG